MKLTAAVSRQWITSSPPPPPPVLYNLFLKSWWRYSYRLKRNRRKQRNELKTGGEKTQELTGSCLDYCFTTRIFPCVGSFFGRFAAWIRAGWSWYIIKCKTWAMIMRSIIATFSHYWRFMFKPNLYASENIVKVSIKLYPGQRKLPLSILK